MKIIEVARQQKDLLNEGMAYIAVWAKTHTNGTKIWFTEDFFPEEVNDTDPVFDEEKLARLVEIAEIDEQAILLNGYYDSWIGSADEPLTAAQIADGIKRHYEIDNRRIKGYLAETTKKAESAEPTDLCDTEQPHEDPENCAEDFREIDGTSASNDDKPDFERDMRMAEEEATVTDDHGGEYDENGEYIKGTGEAVCFPEDGMSAYDVPTMITIELPSTNIKEDILRALIESKATLIKSALGEDGFGELPIEFDNGEGKVAFNWLRFGIDADTVKAWSAFLAAACKFSKTAKRVTAKDMAVENEKFAFRTFLVKIGMNDTDNKCARKHLLRNLKGDSAFATPESKARWLTKHGKQMKEVEANETAE
jgi:hypothetical protein